MEMAELAVNLARKTGEILLKMLDPELDAKRSRERSLLQTVSTDVKNIIAELEMMRAFLRDAEEKPASNRVDMAWVKQVRQLSHEVEDCIDEFSLHLGQHTGKNLKARQIADQIQSIKTRFQDVSDRRSRYKMEKMSTSQSSGKCNVAQYGPQLAARFVEDGQLVGIDGPRKKLVGWLTDEAESGLRLIAVVGGGGLGKTTIVKKALDQVKSTHFTSRAWITVSQVYHVERILRDMIKQISPSPLGDLDEMPEDVLIDTLRSCLQDKRYVIVFDDLWKMGAWTSLKNALPMNNLGSRVILTTRNKKEAEEACRSDISGQTYELEKLDDKSSMDLFCRRAFKNTDGTCRKELKEASQDLVKKCDGLPLAIVSIASVLASKQLEEWKKTIEKWKKSPGCLGSELKKNHEGVDRILTLSYSDLDYNVKLCFLYLSRYPKDHLMLRKDVQRLWIAEGFVEDDPNRAAEEVAESYFSELVNRFLILPSEFSVDGKVKTFRLHDVMLELLVSKSMEENFVTILGRNVRCLPDDVIRRLSFHPGCSPEDGIVLSHVRSLSMFGEGIRPVSPSLRMLRVLDLYDYSGGDDDVLENVGKLLLLRCLMLRRTGVPRLPKSLGKLRNLETLDLRGSRVLEIPSEVTELQQLRVLHGRRSGGRFPRGIGNLGSLQELTGVNLWVSGHGAIEEIGKLTQLRKLGVTRLPRKWEDDFCKSLEAMGDSLRSLKVLGRRGLSRDDEPFLNKLSAPPPQLRSLHLGSCPDRQLFRWLARQQSAVNRELTSLVGFSQDDERTPFLNNLSAPPPRRNWELPSWVGSLENAVKITLEDFHLDDRAVKALGTLEKLMMLDVCTSDRVHNLSFGAAEGFRSLKRLSLEFWAEVSLSFKEGAMPHLESFDLRHFTTTPLESVGLNNLPRLKEIKVMMASGNFDRALKAEIVGHPNHPRVLNLRGETREY